MPALRSLGFLGVPLAHHQWASVWGENENEGRCSSGIRPTSHGFRLQGRRSAPGRLKGLHSLTLAATRMETAAGRRAAARQQSEKRRSAHDGPDARCFNRLSLSAVAGQAAPPAPKSCRSSLPGNVAAEVTRLGLRLGYFRNRGAIRRIRPRSRSDRGARTYCRRQSSAPFENYLRGGSRPVPRGLQPPDVGCYVGPRRRCDDFGIQSFSFLVLSIQGERGTRTRTICSGGLTRPPGRAHTRGSPTVEQIENAIRAITPRPHSIFARPHLIS